MSWQEYVDDHLMCALPNGGTLKSAAIVGLDGGVWAQSPEFPTLGDDEVMHVEINFPDVSQGSHMIVDAISYFGWDFDDLVTLPDEIFIAGISSTF